MTPPSKNTSPTTLFRIVPIRSGETRIVLLSACYFFLLLLSYYLLRPLRETYGISRGADQLPVIWSCTLGVMALINPVYSFLVARWPRRVFIPGTYQCFATMLVVFGILYSSLPNHGGTALGYTFYVWLSVFNLFVVSIFWAFMADLYNRADGQRLFGIIAIGGTLGAIVGSAFTAECISWLGAEYVHWLFYISAFVLELAVICISLLFKLASNSNSELQVSSNRINVDSGEPSPSATAGLALIGKSRLLQSISSYMILYAIAGTFLYIMQGSIVEAVFADIASRTIAFARIDLWTNILTLVAQLFLAHRLVVRVGIPISLLILPIVTLLGFGSLWLFPGFAVLAVFQVARRGLHYAIDRPVREMLYIPLSPDAKYKAKSFIDTFVYRTGDFIGVWITPLLKAMSLSLGLPSIALTALWIGSATWLGRHVDPVKKSHSS